MNIGKVFLLLVSLTLPCFAHKMFPANHDSVALENHYADTAALPRFKSLQEVEGAVADGYLVPIGITVSPKLPAERRYIRPAANDFLLELDSRFYLATGHFLIVNSAVRPESVQRRLCRQNRSAAPATGERASSHERGTTFDLATKVARNSHVDRMKRGQYRWLMTQLAYYQGIGWIHVIEERACLHIMVREDNENEWNDRSVQAEYSLRTESGRDELHTVQAYDGKRRKYRGPVL